MEYKTRSYPLFSACGLNCGLCPRFYTIGSSRCPGCAAEGFSDVHPSCGILSCCQRKGIEYCFECEEFPCGKHDKRGMADSFITHRNFLSNMEKAKRIGMDDYRAELDAKVKMLEELLEGYNDGRRKNFFCLAVNLLDLQDICCVMSRLADTIAPDAPLKEKAAAAVRLFEEIADIRGVYLKLRK